MKYICPNCDTPVLQERWNAGYEYCMAPRCFEILGRKANVKMYVTAPEDLDLTVYDLEDVFPEDDGLD